jgi:hypothetical protein
MLGLRQRIAFTAVLLIGIVPSGSKAFTIEECYAVETTRIVKAGEYCSSLGHCENRRAERLASCSQGGFVPSGASRKDQCLERAEAEYRNCGYRAVGTNRWIQGLQECN